jgi:hypothetical protein
VTLAEILEALTDCGALVVPVEIVHVVPTRMFATYDVESGQLDGVFLAGPPIPPRRRRTRGL